MGPTDLAWAAAILAGAAYLLYRSFWRKKGHCCGCSAGGCKNARREDGAP